MNLSQQYLRRDTLEINGIPKSVTDDAIDDEVIEIFKEAKVNVNRKREEGHRYCKSCQSEICSRRLGKQKKFEK